MGEIAYIKRFKGEGYDLRHDDRSEAYSPNVVTELWAIGLISISEAV